MFHPSRRSPSDEEILAARSKDDDELQSLKEAFTEYTDSIEALGPQPTFGQTTPLHKASDKLLRRCAEIGAKADEVRSAIVSIDTAIGIKS